MASLLSAAEIAFTAFLVAEVTLRATAFGRRGFLGSWWNRLDLFVAVTSAASVVVDMSTQGLPVNPTTLRVLRVLRVARVFRLAKMTGGMRSLLSTVTQSASHVASLVVLLVLLFYIAAAMAVELFGRLSCTADAPCTGLSAYVNFRNLGMAVLALFQVATGDNWTGVLSDVLREPPLCDAAPDCEVGCCANPHIASVFLVSFVILAQFVLLNVVVVSFPRD